MPLKLNLTMDQAEQVAKDTTRDIVDRLKGRIIYDYYVYQMMGFDSDVMPSQDLLSSAIKEIEFLRSKIEKECH